MGEADKSLVFNPFIVKPRLGIVFLYCCALPMVIMSSEFCMAEV